MSATDDKIDEQTAIDWTSAYRARVASGSVKAFLIPVADLLGAASEVMNQGGHPMVRAYLGFDATKNMEKLVIVGTTQDTTTPGNTDYNDMLPSINPNYSIWDFTLPCPTYCDNNNSPLNQ
ncbi:MAG: hypothetical protein AAF466_03090 [Bacteroidota bacterium]